MLQNCGVAVCEMSFKNVEVKNKIRRHEAGNLYLQMIVEHRIDVNKYLKSGDKPYAPL
jgi:hypothetical protein